MAFLPPCTGGVLELRTGPIGGVDLQGATLVCYCCIIQWLKAIITYGCSCACRPFGAWLIQPGRGGQLCLRLLQLDWIYASPCSFVVSRDDSAFFLAKKLARA